MFTKNIQESIGVPSDKQHYKLADLKKAANILDQKQGLAAGLNFLPDVAARKFTPEEMKLTAANAQTALHLKIMAVE